MTENAKDKEKPSSPAMMSALQAVTRLKGNTIIVGPGFLAESEHDDRVAPVAEPNPRQRSKPTGQ